jgi:thioredoxin 1
MSDASVHLKDKQLDKFLQDHADDLVLVDFFALWCPHCQTVGPLFEDLARKYHNKGVVVVKVDVDEAEETAKTYEVEVLPTVVVFRDGKQLERVTGANDRHFFENLITKHLNLDQVEQ